LDESKRVWDPTFQKIVEKEVRISEAYVQQLPHKVIASVEKRVNGQPAANNPKLKAAMDADANNPLATTNILALPLEFYASGERKIPPG
jgi:hypothetical protein